MNKVSVKAADHLEDPMDTVGNAERCAAAAIKASDGGRSRVTVDFAGFKYVSPSYFSVLLDSLLEDAGRDRLATGFRFEFGSVSQKQAFDRSHEAILAQEGPDSDTGP